MYTMEIMGGKRIDNDSKLIYIYIYIFQCLFFIGISKVYDSYIELVNGFVHQPKNWGVISTFMATTCYNRGEVIPTKKLGCDPSNYGEISLTLLK